MTTSRDALAQLANRIADDLDRAAKLPREAVRRAMSNDAEHGNGVTIYEPARWSDDLRYPDRSRWPEAATWLRNWSEHIDTLPVGGVEPGDDENFDGHWPQYVAEIVDSHMIVDDPTITTWWTPADVTAAAEGHPESTQRLGAEFSNIVETILTDGHFSTALTMDGAVIDGYVYAIENAKRIATRHAKP